MSMYYPIGTIVKLSIDEQMLFMIAGYLPRQGDGKIHDYFAVPFPLGLVKDNQYISFNRKCITQVVHVGYCDASCQDVLEGFDQMTRNMRALAQKNKAKGG